MIGQSWANARSWLGGAPRIGGSNWPRSSKGTPLHFMAQIDLGQVAAMASNAALPSTGSLAFFIGDECALVFVPEGEAGAPVMPPADTPDLSNTGGSEDWLTDLSGQPLFPYWPLDLTQLDVIPPSTKDSCDEAHDAYFVSANAVVSAYLPSREFTLSPDQAFAGPPIPDWWQTAIYYSSYLAEALRRAPEVLKRERGMLDRCLKKLEEAGVQGGPEVNKAQALVTMYEGRIEQVLRLEPLLQAFAEEVAAFSRGRDPWACMTTEDIAGLAALWLRNPEFATFHDNQGKFPIAYLKDEMFKALPPASSMAFAALPVRVRDLLNEKRAPRPQWWVMAVHYAKRLRRALQLGVPSVLKLSQDDLAVYRKRLDQIQPKETRGFFGRKRGPKGEDEIGIEADIARTEAKLAAIRQLVPAFEAFVEEASAWAEGHDSWAQMEPEDIEQLKTRMKYASEAFRELRYWTPNRIQDLEALTLRTLATADDRGYATLPEPVRTFINCECLLPQGRRWHQMFGIGIDIQGNSDAMREEGYVMLLQLVADDLMQWSFGDSGVYQFWISPSDLERRNWAGAKMTFECH